MNKTLNQLDPLPQLALSMEILGIKLNAGLPESNRQKEEWKKKVRENSGNDWQTSRENPLIEINSRGQRRTKDYKPPEPDTDIPIPCVIENPATGMPFQALCDGWIPQKLANGEILGGDYWNFGKTGEDGPSCPEKQIIAWKPA